ncbi:hypothetical protein KIN20_024322 [Parelaphostrongylus tenuis]|uniref:Uncharacterized protein n=1 Tax=Parelaphostrongylus tenuis TaxID=148309 RepID=A0AAD5QW86_PARTN|nr:hypothetical protein KIN20_024322 [Parelaphostrongylus tenuis]
MEHSDLICLLLFNFLTAAVLISILGTLFSLATKHSLRLFRGGSECNCVDILAGNANKLSNSKLLKGDTEAAVQFLHFAHLQSDIKYGRKMLICVLSVGK